jgi:hypothetical protein
MRGLLKSPSLCAEKVTILAQGNIVEARHISGTYDAPGNMTLMAKRNITKQVEDDDDRVRDLCFYL